MSLSHALPLEAIRAVCRQHGVKELDVFGSVLRDDFRPDSDLDFLVVFQGDNAGPWMSKFVDLEAELTALLRRPVDVLDKRGIERSRNPFRRRAILETAERIYEA